jgi:biotin carboxyl carrier protein
MNQEKEDFKILNINETEYTTTFTKKYESRKVWQQPDDRFISTPSPGTVLQMLVKPGDKVTAGQKYMVLESMKMESNYAFLRGGTIKKVNVTPGDKIPKGTVVVEFE